ncbi:MAG: FimB/Mfa2 family fimbrial subunit, partial [Odoribacteraceae bacterium]|nr:FimB/Mfa2 family fimbrial subunit [Odoribacteraceae bacterium]
MKSTNTINNSRDARRSRQVESSVATGREHHARRNLSRERSRFFIARGVAGAARKITGSVALLLAALSFVSCIRDFNGSRNFHASDSTALVTLSLMTPATPATRAFDEEEIARVDVLLFTSSDKFYYRATASSITHVAAGQKNFTVKLPVGNDYKMVVLANAGTAVSGLPINTIETSGASRAQVLDALSVGLTTNTTKWDYDHETIPMWGYDDDLDIDDSTPAPPAIVKTISLTRALARVDVSVGDAGTDGDLARAAFELTSVYLYNYSRAGQLAPAVDGAGYSSAQWYGNEAIAPHLPSLPDLKVEGPTEPYPVDDADKFAFKGKIYAFEAAAGTPVPDAGWEKNTCLVIGGM